MAEETEQRNAEPVDQGEDRQPSIEDTGNFGWRAIFRQAFDKARRDNPPANRSGLGRDRTKSLVLLGGAAVGVLLLFLGVFSSPNRTRKPANTKVPGSANLGQRVTPGQQAAGQTGSATPVLNAQLDHPASNGNGGVTAEDVDKTARPTQPAPSAPVRSTPAPTPPGKTGPYALDQIDFSAAQTHQRPAETPSPNKAESDELRKPSLIFVRSAQVSPTNTTRAAAADDETPTLVLPTGTKLVARLESVVTTAAKEPVVAAVEYNYEQDGQIVIPAGAKALGALQQADRSGSVEIRFSSLQLPDGTTEKIEATAMSLTYGPLKGNVSGKKTGTNFLVRTFTGLGQAASYLVGSGGMSAPLDESAFLRDRIATNIGIAGDQELNNLTFNQNIVVSVPGNTRFYLVMEHAAAVPETQAQSQTSTQVNNPSTPSLEELRQLLQLRQEMSAMYQQANAAQNPAQPVSQP